ncbi:YhgE/Pip domain-containing protein [Staphylococcus massiliensis]|uniref:ABC-2 type transporter transmembrane domain-containing protein n=1 Tax=Staphylococcus massiliensis S46 TaxID=1229783 RepID=K9AJX0_9STAP|nr:ABC transporter permease [Staphylococcus massiliensis]EKU46336.1 hypothetical protein C273_09484 [Staphylococcus massiliensis S46]PNZ97792.1 hypothetical protein CD133_10090 [Staphylococcus massiliensis CCUG 55927]
MNILKSRLLWLAPLIALLVLMLLATAFYPGYNPKPHKLPIAIVNNDKGMDMQGNKVNVGEQFVKNIKDNKELKDKVTWIEVDDKKELNEGFKDKTSMQRLYLIRTFQRMQ